MNTYRFFQISALALATLVSVGCGSDDDDDNFESARVENLAPADNTIDLGDGTAIAADFSFSRSSITGNDRVFVLVRLSPGLELRSDTSELETSSGDDKIGAEVTNCTTGEQFLLYDMDRFDLANITSPSRNADGRLKFTVDGISPGVSIVRAFADTERPIFGCGEVFLADEEIAISVE